MSDSQIGAATSKKTPHRTSNETDGSKKTTKYLRDTARMAKTSCFQEYTKINPKDKFRMEIAVGC